MAAIAAFRCWWAASLLVPALALGACQFNDAGAGGVAVGRVGGAGGATGGGAGTAGSGATGGAAAGSGATGGAAAGGSGATAGTGVTAGRGGAGGGGASGVAEAGAPVDTTTGPMTPDVAPAPAPLPPDAAPDLAPLPPDMPVSRPPPQMRGPVAHWRFDEGTGAMVADASGSGNTGTLLGGPQFVMPGFPAAKFANPGALAFDGDDDQVVAGVNGVPAPNMPKTISLWVRPAVVALGSRAFISLTNRSASCGLHLGTKTAVLAAWKWGGDILVSRVSPPGGLWHHVLYTYDGVGHSLRVDGGAPEFSNLPPQSCALTHVVIGNYEGGGNYYQGALDDVRIYDRVLTEVEARALADGRDPAPGNN